MLFSAKAVSNLRLRAGREEPIPWDTPLDKNLKGDRKFGYRLIIDKKQATA